MGDALEREVPRQNDEREDLLQSVERDQRQLQQALQELREAVAHPLGIDRQISRHPLPWIFSGFLIGLWFGSRRESTE